MRDKDKVTAIWVIIGAIGVIAVAVMIITIHVAR